MSLSEAAGGLRASILVVVAGSDGEVHPRVDSPVDGIVQNLGHTATKRHVDDGTLMPCFPDGSIFGLGSGELSNSLLSGPRDTSDNVTLSFTPIGTQDPDNNEVDSLLGTPYLRKPTVVENRRSRRTFQRLRSYVFLYLFDVISRHTYFTLRALALLSFFRRTEE